MNTAPKTVDELCAYLDAQGHKYTRDGNNISAGGALYLRNLTALPDNATLSAGGALYLRNLTALPDNANLSAGGALDLSRLTALPDNANLSAGGAHPAAFN